MGVLSGVLLGPVKLLTWTAEQVLEAAERQANDPAAIRQQLVQLNDDYDRGLVDDEAFLAAEDALLERLEAAHGPR